MSLELKKVTKRVGANVHIHETDLILEKGSFNTLLGPTLAGKTTLMQLMAGLERPTSGELLVRWQERYRRTRAKTQRRNGLSAVHQLPEHDRVREHSVAAARRRIAAEGHRGARP